MHNPRIALSPVEAAPREQPDALGIAPDQEAEAVVLDLMDPAGTDWRLIGQGPNARLDKGSGAESRAAGRSMAGK
jgi:hypothetical protein